MFEDRLPPGQFTGVRDRDGSPAGTRLGLPRLGTQYDSPARRDRPSGRASASGGRNIEAGRKQPTVKYPIAIAVDAGGTATVRVPDVPGCVVVGPTVEEAIRRTPAAVAVHLNAAAQKGERLPPPKGMDEHRAAGTFDDAVRWETVEVRAARRFSPRDFMRARRPDLYSDSATESEPAVDAAYLHFVLEQVTERKEEVAFEHFCRRLAEKEICPNLITQTGPTGGGDSKVDTETHPVAEAIAERWYVGDPRRGSRERWAFAFSAKKDWRPKLRDDIRKLAETGRDYTVAYFVTNQQVPDRARGNLEDELRKKWDLDVRILDRNWIADRVIANGHYELFRSTLQVNLGDATTRRLGRADAERERSLAELDSQINDPDRYAGAGHQLAEDCLETALLARGLDRPRTEVDGRFDRSERIAREHGTERQLLRFTYHRAWTAVCWYEDYIEFERLYARAESLGLDTDNVWDLERLVILWQIGVSSQGNRSDAKQQARWQERTAQLRGALKSIASDVGRPTSSLMARTQLSILRMTEKRSRESLATGLGEIAEIVESARHHLDYPFESMARIVEELVNMAGGDEELDDLLERVIAMQAERCGEAQEGRMRLRRALVCLKAGRHHETIAQAGKAQLLLGRSGDDAEFVQALFATACAYEGMGLLWAARANQAFALHWVLREWETEGELPGNLYSPLCRLIWIEIELGRVSQALCWLEFYGLALNAVDLTEEQIERRAEESTLMDAVLATVVLRTAWPDVPKLDRAPGVLERLRLHTSRLAAMFLLGYEAAVKSETGFDDPEEFFAKLLAQPAGRDVAESTDWGMRWPSRLHTVLFGCRIEVLARDGLASLLLGETALAFIESFLATSGMASGQLSARAELCIEVVARDDAKQPFEHELVEDDAGEVKIVVLHPKEAVGVMGEDDVRTMIGLLAQVLGQLWMPMRTEDLEALFAEERAQDRASLTAQLPVAFRSVLGEAAKVEAKDWMAQSSESLALCRQAPWRPPKADPPSTRAVEGDLRSGDARVGRPASGVDAVRHRDMKVLSVLNLPLWDAARWKGLAYPFARGPADVPGMFFLFEDIDAGRKIFRGWLKKFGTVDRDNTIGLTLVTGVDSAHPDWYRLVVGYRDADVLKSGARLFGYSSRIQEMSPPDGRNLGRFLDRYRRFGRYRIAPMEVPENQQAGGVMQADIPVLSIAKHLLKIVPAWKIGPDDFLRMSLPGVVDPVVPSGEKDPPFYRPSKGGPVVLDED